MKTTTTLKTKSTQPAKKILNDSFISRKSIISLPAEMVGDAANSSDNADIQRSVLNVQHPASSNPPCHLLPKISFMKTFLRRTGVVPIAFLIADLFFMSPASGQTTLVHYGLNGNINYDIENVVGIPTSSQSGLNFGSGSGPCEGSQYAYCSADNNYLQIDINTTGYSSISISWQQKWSSTGTNRGNWILQGDADNNGSYEFSNTTVDVTANCFTVTVSLPSSFDNKSLVHLRIQSNVTSGNYLLLDDVTISGCTPPATPTAGNNGPICTGSTLNLSTPTVSGATYSWTGPNSFTSAVQNPSIANATIAGTGTYSLTVTVGGCTSTAGTTTATVNSSPVSSVTGQNNITCNAGTDGSITISASGGTGSYFYSVDNGAIYKPTITAVSPPYVYGGLVANQAYRIKVKDSNGCISK